MARTSGVVIALETATAATCLDQTPKVAFLLPITSLSSTIPLSKINTQLRNTQTWQAIHARCFVRWGEPSKLSHNADN